MRQIEMVGKFWVLFGILFLTGCSGPAADKFCRGGPTGAGGPGAILALPLFAVYCANVDRYPGSWEASSEPDEEELRQRAAAGDTYAQYVLGRPGGWSPVEAAVLLCGAADKDHAIARNLLGTRYEMGAEGFPENPVQAYKWYSLALESGYEPLRDGKEIVAKKLSPGQLAMAKRLVAGWKPGECEKEVRRALQ